MSCQETTEGQTEFQFFQQLIQHVSPAVCCGPMNKIGFTESSITTMNIGLATLQLDPTTFLDSFDPEEVEPGVFSFVMCSKHWLAIARHLGSAAIEISSDPVAQLAYFIFRVVCLTNEWDYKEVLNYTKTADNIKEV